MGGAPSAPPPPKPAPPLQPARPAPPPPKPAPPPEPVQQPGEVAQVEYGGQQKRKRQQLQVQTGVRSTVNTGSGTSGRNINLGQG